MAIKNNETDKCPHCGIVNRFERITDSFQNWDIRYIKHNLEELYLHGCTCSNCNQVIFHFDDQMIFPLGVARTSAPDEVPYKIKEDYDEACLVESLSSKASAALARRCLQNILHDQGIKKKSLNEEIEDAMKTLPTYLKEAIDAIRNIGNFAAHPIKFTNSGEIVDVEKGEVEWTLDVIEQLFDFYYVQPAKTAAKKAALDKKLQLAGKPPSK